MIANNPAATPTMTPSPTRQPTAQPEEPRQPGEVVKARISHYTPWTGGTNCARFVNGVCVSRMASGKPWQDWIDRACACPKEYPFGTRFIVQGREWVCLDRGGKIIRLADGTIWLDLLTAKEPVPFGAVLTVGVIR